MAHTRNGSKAREQRLRAAQIRMKQVQARQAFQEIEEITRKEYFRIAYGDDWEIFYETWVYQHTHRCTDQGVCTYTPAACAALN
jgi:hypothetical protein